MTAGRWFNAMAVEWVIHESLVDGDRMPVLIVVASHTDQNGRGAFPVRSTVARLARRSARQVVRDLAALVKDGHLLPGDGQLVAHLRGDRRPNVYDLPEPYRLWRQTRRATAAPRDGERGDTTTPGTASRGDTTTPRQAPRGDISDIHGVTSATERGDMVSPKESPEKKIEKISLSLSTRSRGG